MLTQREYGRQGYLIYEEMVHNCGKRENSLKDTTVGVREREGWREMPLRLEGGWGRREKDMMRRVVVVVRVAVASRLAVGIGPVPGAGRGQVEVE